MPDDRKLSDETLRKLREAISIVQSSGPAHLPHAELVEVVRDMQVEGVVTIDFEAEKQLGHPLVVFDSTSQSDPALAILSPRELEVAQLVAQGLANKEIARELGIGLATVKDHVHRILEKTGFPNRAAIAAALRR